MKTIFPIMLSIILFANTSCAEHLDNLVDNPGYFVSPGFVFLGGTRVYTTSSSRTMSDLEARPLLVAMYNLVQSEYGNLGVSFGGIFSTPSRNEYIGNRTFKLLAQQYTGEFGLNYFTGSKSLNFWLGGGYNYNYLSTKLYSIKKTDTFSDFSKRYYRTSKGFYYYMGIEYLIFKDGSWGLAFLFRGQESKNSRYDINEDIIYNDNSKGVLRTEVPLDHNHKTYVLGLTYHF